jgi:MoaA/NifB/PqqE/SkfB family radical SAM enzyme/SAM-dependent methyltransferase
VKALIKVGYGCNDHCTFCHTLDVRHVDAEAEEVHRKIARAKELGHRQVVLSGGEPTIRPELLRWAEHVSSLGMGLGLVTNGRMLVYPELVSKLVARRLEYVYLSLHGGSAKIHNLMVRSNAFDESFGSIANLSGRGLDLTINCVITKHNVDHLVELVDKLLPYRDAKVKLSMMEPKGGGDRLFDHLMPRIAHVAARVREAILHGRARAGDAGPRFLHGGVPLCLLPGLEDSYDDLRTHRFATMVEVSEPDFYPVDDGNKVQPEAKCRGCALRGACPGLYRGYHEAFGADELAPQTDGARGNSFDWTIDRVETLDSKELTTATCPVKARGVTPWEPSRHLFAQHGDRLVRARFDGRDFADVELDAIKREDEQVYLDVSRKDAPDDFERDLVPLRRSRICEPCEHRATCTGLFTPIDANLFAADAAIVAARLESLSGDVLDLGCGDLPYAAPLAFVTSRGRVRYVGMEPDAERVARARVHLPAGRFEVRGAESLEDESAFDHVLVLRSWNHLVDASDVARRILRALRPGGRLFVVDDVPFGLVRTPAQRERAHRGPARLEHARLDTSVDCERTLTRAGFAIEHVRPASAATSTLWMISAAKPAPA